MNRPQRRQRTSNRSLPNRSRRRLLAVEMLEDRRLLAGDTESFWVYYGKGNTLYRSLNDGSQEQTLMSLSVYPGPVNADGIQFELDRVSNKVYATANHGHNPIHLYRANLDGTSLELLNNSNAMGTILQGIAVDELTSNVYVSPHSLQLFPGGAPGGMVRVSNNGQTVTQFSQKPWYVTDMEVDAANGHVYYAVWPSWCCNQTHGWAGIRRMNLDGSNDVGIIETGGNGGFALDVTNNRIWFGTVYSGIFQDDRIYSVALDGTNVQPRVLVGGYTFGDIDLTDSRNGIAFISFPKAGNTNPNPRMQQL